MIQLLTILLATLPFWQDPEVNGVNRLPARTDWFGFETQELADKGVVEQSGRYLSLSGKWAFQFEDGTWDSIQVPGNWELQGYGVPYYSRKNYVWKGWYKNNPPYVPDSLNYRGIYERHFCLPAAWTGELVYLCIGSASQNAQVEINGRFVGYTEDSKLQAHFDVTPFVQKGDNTIRIHMQRWCDGTYLEDQDYWRLTGLSREVYLYAQPKQHINDIRWMATLSDDYHDGLATLEVDVAGVKTQLHMRLVGPKGVVKDTVMSVPKSGKAKVNMRVKNVHAWTAETPFLYSLYVELSGKMGLIQATKQDVGFRKVEIRNRQLLVNGQAVYIKGVNRHELDTKTGYVMSHEQMEEDIRVMKAYNINAVRTSHYPDDPYWYALCDKYGIYMVAEANVEAHGMGKRVPNGIYQDPQYRKAIVERNRNNVSTFRNHPSIIMWSLGNETGDGPNFTAAYEAVRALDPSLPIHYEQAGLGDNSDVMCPMYANFDSIQRYLSHPTKPLIQCEYAHAMGNSLGEFDTYWKIYRSHAEAQGGFIWDFADQGLQTISEDGRVYYRFGGDYEKCFDTDLNFNNNGLFAPNRQPNPHAFEAKYVMQDIHTILLDTLKGEIEVANERFFTDLSDVHMSWQWQHNGCPTEWRGEMEQVNVAPQSTQHFILGAPNDMSHGTWTLDVEYSTKEEQAMLPKGHVVAREQMLVKMVMPDAPKASCGKFHINPATGLIDGIFFEGKALLKPGTAIKPSFWRAPTDNDYGVNLQQRFWAWHEPAMRIVSYEKKCEGETLITTVLLAIEETNSQLELVYTLSPNGVMHVHQALLADKTAPGFFRFGMEVQLPHSMEHLTYCGRGPWENYPDRKATAAYARYSQTVTEQFFPYVRPQETGSHTDVTELILSGDGLAVRIVADKEPVIFSALHHSIESLDDGWDKNEHQSHGALVDEDDATVVQISSRMQGLGGFDSWKSTPSKSFMLPADNYTLDYYITIERQ